MDRPTGSLPGPRQRRAPGSLEGRSAPIYGDCPGKRPGAFELLVRRSARSPSRVAPVPGRSRGSHPDDEGGSSCLRSATRRRELGPGPACDGSLPDPDHGVSVRAPDRAISSPSLCSILIWPLSQSRKQKRWEGSRSTRPPIDSASVRLFRSGRRKLSPRGSSRLDHRPVPRGR